jgi:hypothetical protein
LTGSGYFDKQSGMPLTDEEVKALRLLFKEEQQPFRTEMNKRFDEMATQIDGLYQRDEKREQEYLSIREQIKRIESRMA